MYLITVQLLVYTYMATCLRARSVDNFIIGLGVQKRPFTKEVCKLCNSLWRTMGWLWHELM